DYYCCSYTGMNTFIF
nr:immunoglobulin light chain junction region [Macaca mulatta]